MLNNLLRKSKGFTLIEVVIVLAIAGLIFVIVFLAVSQAQAARRDTQRKNDLNRIGAHLEQYASNKQGTFPTTTQFGSSASEFRSQYIATSNFKDPSSANDYEYTGGSVTCTGSGDAGKVGYTISGRTYVAKMCLERGEAEVTNE